LLSVILIQYYIQTTAFFDLFIWMLFGICFCVVYYSFVY